MIKFLLNIFLLFLIIKCGLSANSVRYGSSRIIGGTNATIEELPWQVSIRYYSINHCGGSIINADTILTAAHCFHSYNTESDAFTVRVGTDRRSVGGQILNVKKIITHPKFNISTYNYDVAIVKLTDKLNFTEKIQQIELINSNETLPVGEFGIASGFGLLSFDEGGFPTILQKVELKVLNQSKCEQKYKDENKITEFMFCAGGNGKHDACKGDSGGPFVIKNKLVGIISYAIKCALPEYPGVFASVATLRNWIDKNILK